MTAAAVLLIGLHTAPAAGATPDNVQKELEELRAAVAELRQQLKESAQETQALKRQLDEVRRTLNPPAAATEQAAESQQVIEANLAELNQTRVASGSKYRVRLYGMALTNIFSTRGEADNSDVPLLSERRLPGQSRSSFGATLRQTTLGLEVFGPTVAGARTGGQVQFDFFGGFPHTDAGLTEGLVRLRTANLTMEWKNTTVVAGQETPFFSPLSPTSFATVGYPALSYAGNLWTWTPQVYVEQRAGTFAFQAGVLDALTGEEPVSEYNRTPTAGERSGLPAFASRVSWRSMIGMGGWYSRQNWDGRRIDGWASTADWNIPLGPVFSVSGEVYRGRAMAGLGGTAAPSLLQKPVDSVGGWAQLKMRVTPKVELNSAFGEDYSFARGLSVPVRRNAAGFLNAIYEPRSNLFFSLEYRRLWTARFLDSATHTEHINVGAGVRF